MSNDPLSALLDAERKRTESLKVELAEEQARYQKLLSDYNALKSKDTRTFNPLTTLRDNEPKSLQKEVDTLRNKLDELQKQIIVAGDVIEMEQFGLYRPQYTFATAEGYKEKLEQIRADQKQMIKDKTAATCATTWTVNGSKKDGMKQTNDIIKLMLRAFNDECEAAISSVKFSNFDRCQQRIQKAFDDCNHLGEVHQIKLAKRYGNLKIAELRLAIEYAQQKQKEKEDQAEIRRQQREQAKLEKEIAEARKAAEKECQHYEQALASIDAQIFACANPVHKAELEAKRTEIHKGLDLIQAKLEDIDYRQTNQRAGYVYIISNIGAFGENVYKIGMTRRLNPLERVDELGDASVPFAFDVHAMIFSADAPALENALHHALHEKRLNKVNNRREYFRVTLDEIKEVIRQNHDQSVEFVDIPAAAQYRESLKM